MILEEEVRTREVKIEKVERKSSGDAIFFLEEEFRGEVIFYQSDLSQYGFSVDKDKQVLYISEKERICDNCSNHPLFDDNNDEYYCPVCQ